MVNRNLSRLASVRASITSRVGSYEHIEESFFRPHAPIRREFRYIVMSCIKVEKVRDRRLLPWTGTHAVV